ncbi:hypothetical protein CVT25_013439 [Psilocybe cyanescens]|uniref:Protein kinase domain-containing protein n=1 Tax=Psilocybe cyanescens TaxID=93625 RepID=A0A409WTA3_PSICY|nr:hypothetical protein CVT25_013439 [Psilocybe cyanescens]
MPLLTHAELDWVKLQPLLLDNGYKLRPRYQPNWKPSWKRPWNFYKSRFECPDSIILRVRPTICPIYRLSNRRNVIDAIRMKDGAKVVIKRVTLEYDNVPILQHLNSPEMRKDSRNNAVTLLEVIPLPDSVEDDSKHYALLFMPMLFPLMSPHLPFRHVREVVDALDQLIQVPVYDLKDACSLNFMMDPTDVIPSSFHHSKDFYQPDGKTRIDFRDRCSVSSVKYYTIDYEMSDYFPPNTLCVGFYGQEKDVPELSDTVPYDPFKLDIFQLGTVVQMFIEEYEGLDFLEPLGEAMTCQNPEMRLTAVKSLEKLRCIVSLLEETDLSRKIWLKDSTPEMRVVQTVPPKPWEADWVMIQPFLKQHGYRLRPRYNPSWKPSWTRPWNFYKHMRDCPDYLGITPKINLIDAVRVYDGVRVVIKRVVLENDNVPILEYLNTPEMLEDPRNNTVPLLDVLPLPDNIELPSKKESVLLVMPMFFPLMSRYLPFLHVKEVLDALNQLIQVFTVALKLRSNGDLVLLRESSSYMSTISLIDACLLNFMMDPIDVIPSDFHYTDNYYQPDGKTRIEYIDRCSAAPIKYYLIDYETADYFDIGEQCVGFYGQVKNVPGTSLTIPYDPFKLDVYQLGDVVRRFTEEYEGLDFLETLSKVMTHHDPDMRPTAAGALQLFRHLVSSFGPTDLSQEIWLREITIEERKAQNMPPKVNNGPGWDDYNIALLRYGDEWRRYRKICQQNFNLKASRIYHPLQAREVRRFLQALHDAPEHFDAHSKRFSISLTMSMMYGYEVQSIEEPVVTVAGEAIRLGSALLVPGRTLINIFPVLQHILSWFPGASSHKTVEVVKKLTNEMMTIPMEYVKKSLEEGMAVSSLVTDFYEKKRDHGASQEEEDMIKKIAYSVYGYVIASTSILRINLPGASDTTISATGTFLYTMAVNPDVQKKAQSEIDRVIGSNRLPTFEDRGSLPYIEAIYREVMRLRPPLPLGGGHTVTEDDYYKGVFIDISSAKNLLANLLKEKQSYSLTYGHDRDSLLHLNISFNISLFNRAMTHDEEVYPDPFTFKPERFFDDSGMLNGDGRILAYGFELRQV